MFRCFSVSRCNEGSSRTSKNLRKYLPLAVLVTLLVFVLLLPLGDPKKYCNPEDPEAYRNILLRFACVLYKPLNRLADETSQFFKRVGGIGTNLYSEVCPLTQCKICVAEPAAPPGKPGEPSKPGGKPSKKITCNCKKKGK